MQTLANAPLVSIIVPTFNSQPNIKQCLESIKKQTYKNVEVLVVDNYSRDTTRQLATLQGAEVLLLDAERSGAKNFAAREARGDFLLFIDSDMELDPRVVEQCVRTCEEKTVQGIVIPEKYTSSGRLGECRKMEKELLTGASELLELPRFFRKEVFLKLGGFDEWLVCGEDFDLFKRFKASAYGTGRITAEIAHSEGSPSLPDVAIKAYNYGETLPDLIEKSPKGTIERYGHIRLASMKGIGTQKASLKTLLAFMFSKAAEYLGYFFGIYAGLLNGVFGTRFHNLMTKVREKSHIVLALSFFVLIALVIFRNFLLAKGLPAGNDLYGWVSREYIFARDYRWLYIWRPYSFGFVEGVNLLDFFFMLTYSLFSDSVLAIEVFLFLSFLLAGFSMYAFAYSYTRSNLAAFSATLVYTLNQWFFSQLTEGHVDIIFSYAFAPLLFLLLDRALRTGKLKNIILSAMALAVFLTGFHANTVVIYAVFLTLFVIMYLFFPNHSQKLFARSKRFLKFLAVGGIVVFFLTAFFTVPFFMNVRAYFLSEEYKYQIEEAISFSASNLTEAFTLGATEDGGYIEVVNIRQDLGLPDFPVQAFLSLVFLAAYSAIIFRRDRYTIFFLIATIISTFISKGSNSPLGPFFTWAWFNIPHFAVFRRPNRWEMMTAFSNAFFVALFVSLILNHIVKRDTNASTPTAKSENPKRENARGYRALNRILSQMSVVSKRILRFVGVTLIILVLLSGLVSCWFFFSNGLLTYKIPDNYAEPFNWVSTKLGDYKVITINKSPTEWVDDPNAGTDFAFCRMLTEVGWVHDIGFDSSIIHDKPVLQDGGWEPSSKLFVDYLRRGLVYNGMTRDFLKILGSFGYRYVVIPPYGSEPVRNFILNQEGGHIVYNESDALVIENDFFTPPIFSPNNYAIVVGGLEGFPSLCTIPSFSLNETALLFAGSKNGVNFLSDPTMDAAKAIVLAENASAFDSILASAEDLGTLILAKNYAVPSGNLSEYWVVSYFWRDLGKLVLGKETLTTHGDCKAEFPFAVGTEGEYEFWIRIAFAPDRGELSIFVDDELLGKIVPETNYWTTLRWIKIEVTNLEKGPHLLVLRNDGSGYNDVDAIYIAEKSVLEARLAAFADRLRSFTGRLIYVFQPEDFLEEVTVPRWTIAPREFEGNLLLGENAAVNISPEGNVTASSTQHVIEEEVDAKFGADANLTSRWASFPSEDPPQWLQIDWATPREVDAVKVYFERAYAGAYLIQTWDDENSVWKTHANVTDNAEFVRLHVLEEPVNTTKLRVYINAFSDFPLVSIYELEAYEKSTTTSVSVSVPRDGRFKFFVRAFSELETGKVYLKCDQHVFEGSVPGGLNRAQWFDVGDVFLKAGEHQLSLGTVGKVGISKVLVSSLFENESGLSLSGLFADNRSVPTFQYERLNPCTYKLQVNAGEPFLLVLSESYNPLWKALVDGEEISPIPVYSFLNGFFINKTGNLTMTIYFTGQVYVDTGLKIASASFLIITALLLTPSKAFAKAAAKVRRTKKGKSIGQ